MTDRDIPAPTNQDETGAAQPVAVTAGEDDHADPWAFAGDDADAPSSTDEDRAAALGGGA